MPVDRPADRADVHGLVRLDLAPAELAVGDEGLVLVDLLGRQVGERDGPAVADDEVDFLPEQGHVEWWRHHLVRQDMQNSWPHSSLPKSSSVTARQMAHLGVVDSVSSIFFILRATLGLMMSSALFEAICASFLFPNSGKLFFELLMFLPLWQVLALLSMLL